MAFEVWGPCSIRHNDNYTLQKSEMQDKLRDLQAASNKLYKIFGDSAYESSDYIESDGGLGMASVRESIEHTYGQLKSLFAYCDYANNLKLMGQPVAKIFFVAMLLRNAHVFLFSLNDQVNY